MSTPRAEVLGRRARRPRWRHAVAVLLAILALGLPAVRVDAMPRIQPGAVPATPAAGQAPAVATPVGRGPAAAAVTALTTAPAGRDPLVAVPGDFPAVMGYMPVPARMADGTVRLAKPAGACSAPGGGAPFGFEQVCKVHDYGYDLLRYAHAGGQRLTAEARRQLDAMFDWDLHARCQAKSLGGDSLRGTWTFTAGSQVPVGRTDLPVAAEFTFAGDPGSPDTPGKRPVHVEEAVRVLVPPADPSGTPAVSDLPFLSESNGYGPVERDRSNGEAAGGDGNPLTIRGTVHPKGLGMHAPGEVTIWTGGACTGFSAQVGIDDEVTQSGSVDFQVLGDGRPLAASGVRRSADPAAPLTADLTGVRILTLRATDGGDGKNFDHADWADARLSCGS